MAFQNMGAGVFISEVEGDVLEGTYYIDWVEYCDQPGPQGAEMNLVDHAGLCIKRAYSQGLNFHKEYRIEGVYTNPTVLTLDAGSCVIKTKKHPSNI